jgi:cyclin T
MESKRKWMYEKSDLEPTNAPDEIVARANACEHMAKLSKSLGLPGTVHRTATIFFQRYFALGRVAGSSEANPIAVAAVFLAAKAEDCPRKVLDVVRAEYGASTGNETNLRASIVTNELAILERIGFDMSVEHPHKLLLSRANQAKLDKATTQAAWEFVEDCYRTTLVLRFLPEEIAGSAIAHAQGDDSAARHGTTPAMVGEMRSELCLLKEATHAAERRGRELRIDGRTRPY